MEIGRDARISSRPALVRITDGWRGSLWDSATASVGGIRDTLNAAAHADTRTTARVSRSAATAGSGLQMRGSSSGNTPSETRAARSRPARR